MRASDATRATFQTTLKLDVQLATLLADRIEMSGADVQAIPFLAFLPADLLIDADVALLIQFEGVQSQFGFYIH
jgi:hypothetical protein